MTQLLNGAAQDEASIPWSPHSERSVLRVADKLAVQTEGNTATTWTVTVQVKADDAADWFDLTTLTNVTIAATVEVWPRMRLYVTASSTAGADTVDAWVSP